MKAGLRSCAGRAPVVCGSSQPSPDRSSWASAGAAHTIIAAARRESVFIREVSACCRRGVARRPGNRLDPERHAPRMWGTAARLTKKNPLQRVPSGLRGVVLGERGLPSADGSLSRPSAWHARNAPGACNRQAWCCRSLQRAILQAWPPRMIGSVTDGSRAPGVGSAPPRRGERPWRRRTVAHSGTGRLCARYPDPGTAAGKRGNIGWMPDDETGREGSFGPSSPHPEAPSREAVRAGATSIRNAQPEKGVRSW